MSINVAITETTITVSRQLQTQVNASITSAPISVTISNVDHNSHPALSIGSPANGLSVVAATQVLSIALASSLLTGALSSTDWTTFNNKQNALGYTPVNVASAEWIDLTDGGATTLHSHAGGGGTWGSITGTLSNQTDLQAALDAKQNSLTFPLAASLGGTGIANGAAATLTLPNLAITLGGGGAAQTYTLPATGGTFALLNAANVFTTNQMIDLSSDVIGLTIQGHSSQTVNHLTVEDSSGTDLFGITRLGGMAQTITNNFNSTGIGTPNNFVYTLSTTGSSWPNETAGFFTHTVINTALNRSTHAFSNSISYRASSGNYDAVLSGGNFQANSDTTGGGYVLNLIGGNFTSQSFSNRAGYAQNYYAGKFIVVADANAAKTAVRAVALYVPSITGNGNVTVPLVYGLLIDDQTFGTTRYAIYTGAGIVSLLGSNTVASAAGATWSGIQLRAATATITGSTNITTATGFNYFNVAQPTLSAASALTVTNSATIYIANAPAGGGAGPATITNPYSIWVDAGISRFDGNGTYIFELPADATGNISLATGRIPVKIGGVTKYIRYYDD